MKHSSNDENRKRPLKDYSDEVGNNESKIEVSPLNPIVFYLRFPFSVEKIFEQLNKGSLRSCREVSKSWLDSIDSQNLFWKKNVK